MYTLAQLEPEYLHRLAVLRVTRTAQVRARAAELVRPGVTGQFRPLHDQLGIPIVWMVCSFERECGCNFSRSPAQGDRWDRRSVNEPISGPFSSWYAAALWSYRHDHSDHPPAPWSWAVMCYEWEVFNGLGPRMHGRVSGYNFAGTDQYDPPGGRGGKYVSDGEWSAGSVDEQLGCVPLAMAMVELLPELAVPGMPDRTVSLPPVTPVPLPELVHSVEWVQNALNRLGAYPVLQVDGNPGRRTAAAVRVFQTQYSSLQVDGLIGRATIAALDLELTKLREAGTGAELHKQEKS